MFYDFSLSADMAEHLVGVHVIDYYSFLILEYSKQETL